MTKQPMKFLIHALLLCAALLGSAGILASEKVTYFHNEPTGSAAMATDEAGNVAWKETYRPFGDRLVRPTGAADNSVWYAGRHQEAGIGLSYLGARYYDAALGRFVSVDAAEVNPEDLHSFNRYAYANNNPYRYVDPDGNTPLDIAFLAYDLGKLGVAVYTGVGVGAAAADVGLSILGVASPVPGAGQALKAARVADRAVDGTTVANKAGTETVQRWMSKTEFEATQNTGLLRGGREGTHYVTDAANSDPLRARQRLALPKTPEVRVTMEVPGGVFSNPSKIKPDFKMPGGGMERTASGNIPVKILRVDQ